MSSNSREEKKEQTKKFSVDEDWKKSVEEERKRLDQREQQSTEQPAPEQFPEPDFRVFLAGLYTQTLVALGELEHPESHKRAANLPEARYLIDTINMLKQKTQGNLTGGEETYLSSLLHDLRMRYVNALKQSALHPGQQPQ